MNLTPGERETIISWADDDKKIFISTTQRKIMTKLKKNPLFELQRNLINNTNRIGVEGYLPLNSISIRTKMSKRQFSEQERENARKNLKKARNVRCR